MNDIPAMNKKKAFQWNAKCQLGAVQSNCWYSTEMQGGEAGALHKRRAGPFTGGWASALYHIDRGQTDMAENITFATLLFQKERLG